VTVALSALETLRLRLPSREQARLLFLAILVPVNFWALVIFLQELPAYILRMNAWDITGILAYVLTIALLDSLILLFFVTVIMALLPVSFRKHHYTTAGTLIAYLTIFWLVLIQYQDTIGARLPIVQQRWFIWVWLAALLTGISAAAYLLSRSEKLDLWVRAFVDRLSLLSTVYLFLNLAGLLVVLGRNLSAGIG